jgi:hypothetical protein
LLKVGWKPADAMQPENGAGMQDEVLGRTCQSRCEHLEEEDPDLPDRGMTVRPGLYLHPGIAGRKLADFSPPD